MSVFCFLWIPLFFLFIQSVSSGRAGSSGAWAVIFGSITAILSFFFGPFVEGGVFGFSRWLEIFVDLTGAPILLPMVFYALFLLLRLAKDPHGFASFTLLWLTPCAIMQGVKWFEEDDPSRLVLIPLLWSALAAGGSFFISLAVNFVSKPTKIWNKLLVCLLCFLGIPLLLFLSTTAYWAFFSQKIQLGFELLVPVFAPLVVAVLLSWLKKPEPAPPPQEITQIAGNIKEEAACPPGHITI
ncbi:MAG: hypothetical protein LBI40_03970 [Treponema sp.]|jgi:hypothetical protein|nr:hypothetical protein [Treponema sp.]